MELLLLWRLLVVAAILAIAAFLGSWASALTSATLARGSVDPTVQKLLVRLVRPVVLLLGAVVAVQYLELDLTPISAIIGASTLAIGMALQGSLSNVASGALLLSLRPLRIGEVVEIAGHTGLVVDQTFFHVVLDLPDGRRVTLPNNLVFASPIGNLSRREQRRAELLIVLAPGVDVPAARAALRDAVAAVDGVLDSPAAEVVLAELSPRGPQLAVRGWCASADVTTVRPAMAQAVLDVVAAEGIELAKPPMV